MRVAILILALLPFVVLAARDLAYHLRARKPGVAEDLLHLLLGVAQVALGAAAFRGDLAGLVLATLVVAVFGALDEFVFHHALPERESDLHAKGHFALFGFVAVALAVNTFPDAASVVRALSPR